MSAPSRIRLNVFAGLAVTCLTLPILQAILPNQAVPRVLGDDRFFGSRHTGWPANWMPVAGFRDLGGDWLVVDDVLHVNGGFGPKLIYDHAELGAGACGVEMLLANDHGGNAGLIVKVSDAAVGADQFNGYEISVDAQGQFLRLARHRQNYEPIRDVPCRVPVNQWFALVVRMGAKSLSIEVDGQEVLTFGDDEHALSKGRVGFRVWQREASYRRFWIQQLDEIRQVPLESGISDDQRTTWISREGIPPVAVVLRHPLSAPPAAGQDLWASQPRAPGCEIRVIYPGEAERAARTIFSDPTGCIYDMNVSYDAKTLYFSYRQEGEPSWHIWRIGSDGTNLKRLTSGPHSDVSPCELPDGGLAFVSTRRFGFTVCQPGPASNLFRMSSDGTQIRCLSMNTLSDFTPQMLPDGRLLFTRWEYIDRDLTYRQSLWTQYPDGTAYQLYFGNTVRDVGTFWQARPIPGRSGRVVATFAPHHGFPHGAIGLIDRGHGPEGEKGIGFAYITRQFGSIEDRRHEWAFRDPFPLDDSRFLCSFGDADRQKYGIYLLSIAGHKRLLYEDEHYGCYYPIALTPSAVPPQVPTRCTADRGLPKSEPDEPMGTFLLADVYQGLEPSIARGRVKFLRVMEQIRKTEDLVSRAYDQSPVMSYGTYYAKRCWGTVPVELDGSAHFNAPALREIYFQALDSQGRELQRMTSAVQVMPGEQISCIGCHESRQSAPPVEGHVPMAARHGPVDLENRLCSNDGIVDFCNLVQPVLDRYCVECHRGGNPDGGYDLTGDKTRYFNMAYDNLLGRSKSYRQHDMSTGEMLPSEMAKGKPLVHFYWLLQTPTAVNQPLWTGTFASRLPDYLEADHCGHEIPVDERQRIYLWIDANVPYYGTYAHARPKSPGRRDLWTDVETGQLSPWLAENFLRVYNRRCFDCHGKFAEATIDWDGRFAWINLTRPEFSPALTAHLSRDAGGRGIPCEMNGKNSIIFEDKNDPDYQLLLQAIETGKQLMLETPAADMPGFTGARPEP
jgi:hypothetical protein